MQAPRHIKRKRGLSQKARPSRAKSGPQSAATWQERVCQLEMRVAQLKAENEALQLKQVEWTTNSAPPELHSVGIARLDKRGVILDLNRAAADLLGTGRSRLLGHKLAGRLQHNQVSVFENYLKRCAKSNVSVACELAIRNTGFAPVVARLAISPIRGDASGASRFEVTMIDITAAKKVHEDLEAAEKNLRALFDASPHPIQYKDHRGRWILANCAALALLDLKRGEYRFKSDAELAALSPFYRALLEDRGRRDRIVMEAGETSRMNESVQTPDGATRLLDVIRVPVRQNNGRPGGLLVLGYDITERKRDEAALRVTETQLKVVTETTSVMLSQCSRDLRYLFVNRAYARFIGLTPEEIIGKPISEILGKDGFAAIEPHVRRVLSGESVEFETELRVGSEPRFIRVAYEPDRESGGWVAAIVDVTDRKQAQLALEESESRFRTMAESAPMMIWMAGPDKRCTYINQTWLEFTGRTLNQELGNGWAEGIHPEDKKRCLEAYCSAFDARKEFEIEYRLRRHDGVYRWIIDKGSPRFTWGEFAGYIGTCMDITERREAAEALRKSRDDLELRVRERTAELVRSNTALQAELIEHSRDNFLHDRLASIVESSWDSIISVGLDGAVLSWNKGAERVYGYSSEEMIGQPLSIVHPPDRRDEFRSHVDHVRRGENVEPFETSRIGKGGRRIEVVVTLSPILDEDGKVVAISHIARDITEQKAAERALHESELRLHAILDHTPAMIYLKDTEGRYLHFNRRFAEVFKLHLPETTGITDADIFPPAEAAALRAADQRVIDARKPIQTDETVMHQDGPHPGIVTRFPLFDPDGTLYAVGAIATDISDRRRLETEVLNISEREQRRIAQDLHDGLGQQLAGLWCLSETLRKNLANRHSPSVPTAAKMSRLLDAALSQARSLSRGLHPVSPESNGLMSALEEMANRVEELFNVPCKFKCPQPVLVRDNEKATHLFRIAQEAVTNSLKHGRAKQITISLSSTPNRITMAVMDNGKGFPENDLPRKGMGLRIMNYRAGMIGGALVIRKQRGGGTGVICSVDPTITPDAGRPAAISDGVTE